MNPLDLQGPEFLVWYTVFSAVVVGVTWALQRFGGPRGLPHQRVHDAYAMALVRGGQRAVVQTAIGSLTERKLLAVERATVCAVAGAEKTTRDPLEQAILRHAQQPVFGWRIDSAPAIARALAGRQQDMEELGLAPDEHLRWWHQSVRWLGVAAVVGVAVTKVAVALSRGHQNVGFLVILGIIASFGVYRLSRLPTATPRGRNWLHEMEILFGGARQRRTRMQAEESLFVAALFGITALPGWTSHRVQQVFFQPKTAKNSGSSCGTSSSCSSSSCGSSGCGSGCGGCGS